MYRFESDDGFRAGISTWGYFILFFYLLAGFSAELSILLGAFGGTAVGVITSYVKAEKLLDEEPKPNAPAPHPAAIRRLGSRLFDRLRRSKPDEPETPEPIQPQAGRWRSSGKRPTGRYLGRRPPRKIGKD
jgi:hypothetical protein